MKKEVKTLESEVSRIIKESVREEVARQVAEAIKNPDNEEVVKACVREIFRRDAEGIIASVLKGWAGKFVRQSVQIQIVSPVEEEQKGDES